MARALRRSRRLRPATGGLALLTALALLLPATCGGRRRPAPPPHPEVLVVVNGVSPISVAIGDYYRQKRNIPAANVVTLSVPITDPDLSGTNHENVSRADFEATIRDPIASYLTANGLTDQIVHIVLAKGIPLKINGSCPGSNTYLRDCDRATVDAELALLFTGLDGVAGVETMVNPYYGSTMAFADWRAANPGTAPTYLVSRLTGYQSPLDPGTGIPVDVKQLIDRAQALDLGGVALVDEDPNQPLVRAGGNTATLGPAGGALAAAGVPAVHDTSPTFVSDQTGIAAYASWGSNDQADAGPPYYGTIGGKLYPGTFAARALVTALVSTNARGFTSPPSYGQSLLADLITLGAAGAAGHAIEPTLAGVVRPHHLLYAYLTGAPAGEAYWRSVPYLGWMNVYVGDPLMQAITVGTPTGDRDGDGVADTSDNCIEIPNADQRDTDADGFGNVCDADLDGDGVVSTSWGVTFPPSKRGDLEEILVTAAGGGYDADQDLDGDGDVDDADGSIAQMSLFLPPGPSGLVP